MSEAIVLGANQYGKAEIRLVHVTRAGPAHVPRDLTVSVALSGETAAAYLTGDNSAVLSTDAQKNTVYAFAAEHGIGEIEEFALLLARHFAGALPSILRARVTVAEQPWEPVAGTGHSFARSGQLVRTATVTVTGTAAQVSSGLRDLMLMNTAGSEFRGFARDRYTTLAETTDRILATVVNARWLHTTADVPWRESFETARDLLVSGFARTHSYSLQQTLFAMGRRLLEGLPEVTEVRLSLPNKHHVDVDVRPFGVRRADAARVCEAPDRPYGLIEGTVRRGMPAGAAVRDRGEEAG